MSSSVLLFTLLTSFAVVFGHPHTHLEFRATPQVYGHCLNSNEIALTFDDGPFQYLRSISDQFTAAGAKATFFFNGNNWDCIYNPDRISDIQYAYAAGHMLASHSWSHPDLSTLSRTEIHDSLYRMEEAFSRIVGIKPAFLRPPYGNYNEDVRSVAAARGQSLALWDWDTGDADGNTTAQSKALLDDIANAKVKNANVLSHEVKENTATELVPYALDLFKRKGYKLVTIAQCLGVEPYNAIGVRQQPSSTWTCNGAPAPGAACGGSIPCQTGTPVFSSAPSTPSNPPSDGARLIKPKASSSTCLTAPTNANGGAVVVSPCNGSASQSWKQIGQVFVVYGNMCLDVTKGSTANGTKMQIWSCNPVSPNANKLFTVTSSKQIQWVGQGKCLDLTDGSLKSGNKIQTWSCVNGNNNQAWNIV
ncbi:hypothetical protein R3P38DRAFT_2957216 [Favolaschia claudopus]|uniref:NodB homology domain-containing protein n=1 Tax=Favolaschia claudopus TaxID=2862362 RepID=A0AAW0BBI9_9AGAR